MKEQDTIPLPHPSALSQPHWDGCLEGKLLVQWCRHCDTYVFIPQPRCTGCQADDLEWVESGGRGTVYSYTVVHRPPRPQFDTPYAVAIIELEEGWHMLSNVIDCPLDKLRVGMDVAVAFHRMSEEIALPYFVPV